MMNIRSLFLLLFFAHHNVWAMDYSSGQLSNPAAAASKIKLVPESYTRIREWAIAEKERRAQTAATNIAIAEMPAQIEEEEAVMLPALTTDSIQKSAATQLATTVRATSPAQQKQQNRKKKKKKKKGSTEDLDALLAAQAEKDAQQRPKSLLRSSPNTNDQTITLDPERDFLADNFLTQIKLADATCIACKKILCRNRHHSTRTGTVKHPSQDRDLEFTRLLSGPISLHDAQDGWKFVARPHGDSWKLTFNQGYAQRNAILKQLNASASNDSSTEKEDSCADPEDDTDEEEHSSDGESVSQEEEEETSSSPDSLTDGANLIVKLMRASRQDRVLLDEKTNAVAEWVDPKTKAIIKYSKHGKCMFLLDAETGTIIA